MLVLELIEKLAGSSSHISIHLFLKFSNTPPIEHTGHDNHQYFLTLIL